jgi:uncharacterized protein YaiE (UPF0345 family)
MRTIHALVAFLFLMLSLTVGELTAQTLQVEPAFLERFDFPLALEYSDQESSLLYIVSREGYVYVKDVDNPEEPSEIFIDISDRITRDENEQGLLGMAFSPDYLADETFYLYYTYEDGGEYYSTLSRFKAPGGIADADSEERLLDIFQQDDNHNGGQITFGPDGFLYMGVGDGGRTVNSNGQNTLTLNGNILRIDVSTATGYAIPSDNPFVGDPDGLDEIYAWGFRNPWRISFDPVTGYLWVADVGQKDWESIYIVENGKNYGWPVVEGSECYPIGTECDKTGLEMPLYEYPWGDDFGKSITGGYVYRGADNPSLYGKYIYGDFITRQIWALEINHDTKEVISNTEIGEAEQPLPTFGLDSRGEIYIAGWGTVARIFRFEPEESEPPGVVSLVSPEDGAVDVSVDPVLNWEAVVQGTGYRVQVAGDSDFSTVVVDQSDIEQTQYEVSGLAFDTTYYWRVRASNDAGDGAWSAVWSFTTEDEPLSPPDVVTLTSPEDGAVDVSVDPVLNWEAVEQGTGYRVQVSGDSGFGSTVVDQSVVSGTQLETEGLSYETTYFWRVRASNDAGDGAWSVVWSFTTEEEPVEVPGVITLLSPEDGVSGVSLQPELMWQTDANAETYDLQLSLSSDLSSPLIDQVGLTESGFTPSDPLSYETTYYWRVRASNDAGDGAWSAVWSFTTEDEPLSPPGVVLLVSPEDGAADVSVNPVLDWQSAEGAAGYRVQVSGDSEFGLTVVDQSGISGTQLEASGLAYETTYYWRVRATNDAGDGAWSSVWSFTTEDEPLSPPGVVSLVSPEDGAVDVSVDPVLNWEAVAQGTGYRVQVAGDSDFSTVVVDQSEIDQTQYEVSGLAYETTYYWRVRASNDAGDGVWSVVWSFTTHGEPVIEDLVLTEKEESLELSWDLSVDVDISEFRVYRGSSVSELQLLESLPAGTKQYTDTDLPEGAFVYVVTLLDIFGEENGFSNIVSYYNADVVATKEWTLVSIPVNHEGIEFPGSNLFGFDRVYRSETELKPGRGYWVKSSASDGSSEQVDLRGRGLEQATLAMNNGWNLVGGLIDRVTVSTIGDPLGILTTAPVYSYNEGAYQEVTELEPSEGYWIYAQEEGTIDLEISSEIQVVKEETRLAAMYAEESDRIVFSREGREFIFRVSASALDRDRQFRYLMPPRAPEPVLDVRTAQGFRISDRSSELLELTSPGYPVKVEFMTDEASDHVYRLIAEEEDGTIVHINLMPGRGQFINKEYKKLTLERIHRDEAILETSIAHNYPNPFNPSTTIRYRIAQQSEVVMDVFDVAGRRVARLVNSVQEPGEYFVQFDGSALASGVYFLRLQASSFVDVQKLTLIK